jgi:hypothetical protein
VHPQLELTAVNWFYHTYCESALRQWNICRHDRAPCQSGNRTSALRTNVLPRARYGPLHRATLVYSCVITNAVSALMVRREIRIGRFLADSIQTFKTYIRNMRTSTNILNKQSQTADKGWSSILRTNNTSP